jgi:hypothetical protein
MRFWRIFRQKQAFRPLLGALLLAAAPLSAQQSLVSGGVLPTNSPVSGYWKTRLLFSGAADAFMDPNDYASLQFDALYTEVQGAAFSKRYAGTAYLAGGAAMRLSDYYVALFFDGSGDDLFFGARNSLYALIGTASFGAFKPFYKTFSGETLFGAGWGMNFEMNAMTVKPEFMLGYAVDGDPDNGWKGYVDCGAALGIEFNSSIRESSMDVHYELKAGAPMENRGALISHYLDILYRRIYGISDTFQAGWFAGAGMEYIKHEANRRAYYERWDFTPMGGIGIQAEIGDLFSLSGQLFSSYKMDHEDNANSSILINSIIPVAGGTFTPYKGFTIEMSTSPVNGLGNFSLWNISIAACFRK